MSQCFVFVITNEAIITAAGAFTAFVFACLILMVAARRT